MIFHSTYKKPVLIVGNGTRESGAVELLHRFASKTKIPVLTTMNAVDLVQGEEKIGFIGVYGNRVANIIVSEADLIISIGARLGLRQVGNKTEYFAPNAHLIRADIDQFELSRNIKRNEEKYLNDAKEFLEKLMEENIPVYSEWYDKCRKAKELLSLYDKELGNYCMEEIAKLLPENPVCTIDVGQNQCWAAQSLTLKGRKGRIIIGGSYGCMGCSLPYAIGASIARHKEIVYCITGDGGLQMNIQELQTVFSENLPIKIMVINNRTLGKIREIQAGSYGQRFCITTQTSGYTVPDFEKLAMAYGIKAKTLADYRTLSSCKEWLYDDEPCLINIILPEDTLLLPKMNWNQKDMFPALPEQVVTEVHSILA